MEVYNSVNLIPDSIDSSSVTMGTFDGMHQGHIYLIKEMLDNSMINDNKSVLITFHPNPSIILNNIEERDYHLISKEEKYEIIEKLGVDIVLDMNFNMDMASIEAEEFLEEYIIQPFNPTNIVIGYDHHFGKNRKGNSEFLKKYKEKYIYKLKVVDSLKIKDKIISSSSIRTLISDGKISEVNEFIGRNYSIKGKIIKGESIGREISFPTANIAIESINQMIPLNGVYFINTKIDKNVFTGMCNIGFNPTVSDRKKISIEVHIFNYNNFDLYGQFINIEFVDYVRSEIKFDNLDQLKTQLLKDKEYCESL